MLCEGLNFGLELTKEEQVELDARSKEYTSPYRVVMRAKIVLLASQGLGHDRIAARLGMPAPNRQQVASALLLRAPAGPRRPAARRATSPRFPPVLWLRRPAGESRTAHRHRGRQQPTGTADCRARCLTFSACTRVLRSHLPGRGAMAAD